MRQTDKIIELRHGVSDKLSESRCIGCVAWQCLSQHESGDVLCVVPGCRFRLPPIVQFGNVLPKSSDEKMRLSVRGTKLLVLCVEVCQRVSPDI